MCSSDLGYGVEYGEVVDVQRLGAICCKRTTLKARIGNPPPRVTETPGGMLNSIGLQNPGVAAVLEKYGATWASWETPVIVNVAGESVDDYVAVARKLDGQPGVAGIELNISCPNVGKGGLQFALDADAAGQVTRAVRAAFLLTSSAVALGAQTTIVGSEPAKSPFQSIIDPTRVGAFGGLLFVTDNGPGVAPKGPIPVVGLRYDYHIAGPTYFTASLASGHTTRTILDYNRSAATRNIGERLSAADRNSGGGRAGSASVVTATVFSRHTEV